jgi:XTP/dITP diphosphohydrolase|tara:strand:- start:2388 stop:2987 length:600 start_codon:yes stop_codon:yes gene_type:complete
MKKNNLLLIGTHNDGKFREISRLISKKIRKISPKSLKINAPKETGKTFKSNSELKANFFYNKSRIISLSDDSGLEIFALKKKPGIYSARWAKKSGSFKKAMLNILRKIKNKKNRKARFICSLSIKLHNKKIITSIGIVSGNISLNMFGKRGFGYDPIFIPNGSKRTFGQMNLSKKMKTDHRSIAFKKLKKKLKFYKFFI